MLTDVDTLKTDRSTMNMQTTIFLIRHGRTRDNEERRYSGRGSDPELSAEGRRELLEYKRAGVYSEIEREIERENGREIGRARIYTSGMARTEETLSILAGGDVRRGIRPDLCEMDFGVFEGKTYEMLRDVPAYQEWIRGDNESNLCPGGESGSQMKDRVLRAYGDILAESGQCSEGSALIVTHAGPIAAIMGACFAHLSRNRYEWQPACGRGYRIRYRDEMPVSFEPV